jgi:DnaK suppressor protein
MDIQKVKEQLLALEIEFSARTKREAARGRGPSMDGHGDAGDASTVAETESEEFAEAELHSTVLTQVREALRRIGDGSFGRCVVDGGPIEAKRLEAVPWSPYCLKHQNLLEAASRLKTPTL